MPRRRRRWSSTIHHLLFDVITLARVAVTSHAQLAAENLFLRKQLALYQERRVKPKRPDRPREWSSRCFHACWTGARS